MKYLLTLLAGLMIGIGLNGRVDVSSINLSDIKYLNYGRVEGTNKENEWIEDNCPYQHTNGWKERCINDYHESLKIK